MDSKTKTPNADLEKRHCVKKGRGKGGRKVCRKYAG